MNVNPQVVEADVARSSEGEFLGVWIDKDLCTGDGICEAIAPDVFTDVGGLWHVKDLAGRILEPGEITMFAQRLSADVFDAADECPGECIFIETSPEPFGIGRELH